MWQVTTTCISFSYKLLWYFEPFRIPACGNGWQKNLSTVLVQHSTNGVVLKLQKKWTQRFIGWTKIGRRQTILWMESESIVSLNCFFSVTLKIKNCKDLDFKYISFVKLQ